MVRCVRPFDSNKTMTNYYYRFRLPWQCSFQIPVHKRHPHGLYRTSQSNIVRSTRTVLLSWLDIGCRTLCFDDAFNGWRYEARFEKVKYQTWYRIFTESHNNFNIHYPPRNPGFIINRKGNWHWLQKLDYGLLGYSWDLINRNELQVICICQE